MTLDFSKYLEPACNVFSGNARKETVSLNDREELQIDDEQAIRSLCRAVFPADGQQPSPDTLWQFNTILVQVAEQYIVKPNYDTVLGAIANTKQVDKGVSLIDFTVEKDYNIKFSMIAANSGHKLVKIGDNRKVPQVPFTIGFGVTYDPLTKTDDEVEWFNKAVKEIGRAKLAYIYTHALKLMEAASALPVNNTKVGSNLTYDDARDLAAVIRRRTGGKPVLLADAALLDNIARSMVNDAYVTKLMFDGLAEELFGAYAPQNFGTFSGVELDNPYIDDENSKVALPVNTGIMFGSNSRVKPLNITMVGGMTQKSLTEIKNDRVQLWVQQELAITMLYPQFVGLFKDTAVTL